MKCTTSRPFCIPFFCEFSKINFMQMSVVASIFLEKEKNITTLRAKNHFIHFEKIMKKEDEPSSRIRTFTQLF